MEGISKCMISALQILVSGTSKTIISKALTISCVELG